MKKTLKEKRDKLEKGITLVALVVTIVVLLILVGVVGGTFSKSGVIRKAKEAKNQSLDLNKNDITAINCYSEYIENSMSRIPNIYQEVEYLQGTTGGVKVSTGINNELGNKYTISFMPVDTERRSNDFCMFGINGDSNELLIRI